MQAREEEKFPAEVKLVELVVVDSNAKSNDNHDGEEARKIWLFIRSNEATVQCEFACYPTKLFFSATSPINSMCLLAGRKMRTDNRLGQWR